MSSEYFEELFYEGLNNSVTDIGLLLDDMYYPYLYLDTIAAVVCGIALVYLWSRSPKKPSLNLYLKYLD